MYYLSICTIIKDEPNLEEFILFHYIQGVEHFFIYDNESAYPLSERLSRYFFTQICTIINFPGKPQQINSYKHCLSNYGYKTKWLLFADGDEYICPKIHYSIREFLNNYDDVHAIGINWVFFGTSFHDKKQDGFIIDKYRYRSNQQDQHIKTVCKPEFTKTCNHPHFVELYDPSKYVDSKRNIISGPFNNNYNIDIIQINHYYTKSLENSYEKQNRGRTDCISDYNIPHLHNINNDVKDDYCPDKYLYCLNFYYELININWEIYKALNPDLELTLNSSTEYYKHLFEYGINEKRYKKINDKFPNFNRESYRNNNPDLKDLNDLELEKHYIHSGYNEGRICE